MNCISNSNHESCTLEQSLSLGRMPLGHNGASRLVVALCRIAVVGGNLFSGWRHACCLGCPTCQAKDYRTINNTSSTTKTTATTEKGNQGSHGCFSDARFANNLYWYVHVGSKARRRRRTRVVVVVVFRSIVRMYTHTHTHAHATSHSFNLLFFLLLLSLHHSRSCLWNSYGTIGRHGGHCHGL